MKIIPSGIPQKQIFNDKQDANFVTVQSAFRVEVIVREKLKARKKGNEKKGERDVGAIWREKRYIRHVWRVSAINF
jgi:hypothetical protein